MITTTLAAIRAASPCQSGWTKLTKSLGGIRKYGLNTPLPVSAVLDRNGLDDALWVLAHACGEEGKRICHLFACDAAEHVLHIFEKRHPNDTRPRRAIEVKRLGIEGKATNQELDAARAAAWAAARAAEVKWQEMRLHELIEHEG